MTEVPGDAGATARFVGLVNRVLTELDADPAPDVLGEALSALDSLDDTVLDAGDALDLEILRGRLAAAIWQADAPSAPLGERVYAAALWYLLDTRTSPEQLLVRAESELMAGAEELAEVARDLRLGEAVAALDPHAVGQAFRRYQSDPQVDQTLVRPVPFEALRLRGSTGVRARFPSSTLMAGWDAWTRTHLLPPRGATTVTPWQRFVELVRRARTAVRAVVDVRVNTHGAGLAEVRGLVVHQAFEPSGSAAALHAQALGSPTALAAGFVGLEELRGIIEAQRALIPGIDQEEIADRVLAFGPISPAQLAGRLDPH